MGKYNLEKMQCKLEPHMDGKRFRHTLGVMYTCAALAMCHGYDIEKAEAAGLLHDCAKCIPDEEKLSLCREHNIGITEAEQQNLYLLHAKVGVYIAQEKYGMEDKEILNAIRFHTTGRKNMGILEKIVYIADFIEPLRDKVTNLDEIRKIAFQDLDMAMYRILESTLSYLDRVAGSIDQTTKEAYGYYREQITRNNQK